MKLLALFLQLAVCEPFLATGYSNDPTSINVAAWRDGLTATYTPARRGVCAADWNVLPVGTFVYVPDYGFCRVEDRGAAIIGRHVDLFFPTRREALNWGAREVWACYVTPR